MTIIAKLAICFYTLQFFGYEELRKAEREAQEAREKFYFGVLSLAVFAAIWVFQRIVQALRRVPSGTIPDAVTVPPKKIVSNIFRGLALVCIAAAAYVLYLRVTGSLPITAYLLVASLGSLGGSLLTSSRRLGTPLAEDVLAADPRAPILFLRSFDEEEQKGFEPNRLWGLSSVSEQFEEAVLEGFGRLGPVVGLTNVKLRGRPLAYAPYDTLTANWQERVDTLLAKALVIVVVVATSDGVSWEIRQIRDKGYLTRTLFIFPPIEASEVASRLAWLKAELGLHNDRNLRLIRTSKTGVEQPLAMRLIGEQSQVYLAAPEANGYIETVERALSDKTAA